MEALITRQDPLGDYPGEASSEQALTIEEVLKIYTIDGARALGLEEVTGSLTVGKSADLIVLQENLLTLVPASITDVTVDMTLFEGQVVHKRASSD